jgi:hypothetical protein
MATARREFRIEDLLLDRSVNILVGDSGLGKTPFGIQAGLCVASGTPFLGQAVVQGPVLYCDAESNMKDFIELVQRISRFLGLSDIPSNFEIWSPNWDPSIGDDDTSAKLLLKRVAAVKPAFVIVDPLRSIWPDAEVKTSDAMAMIHAQRRLTSRVGCTFLNNHHRRKPDYKNPVHLLTGKHRWFEEAAGARALVNNTDTRLGVVDDEQPGADLSLAGFMRSTGWLGARHLIREYQEGEPVGYRLLHGVDLLSDAFQAAFLKLSPRFRFKDAAQALGGNSGSNTANFLKACVAAGIAKHDGSEYVKTVAEG